MAPPFSVFDAFDKDAKLPDDLTSAKWLKMGAPVSATDQGKALNNALLKLEALYKKVDVRELRPQNKGKPFESLSELEAAEKAAKSAYRSDVVPLVSQAIEVRKQAQALAKICQSNPKVPRQVTSWLVQMGKHADEVADDLKDLGAIFRPFDEGRKLLVKATDHVRKLIGPHLQNLKKGLDFCLRNPTREAWDKTCKGPCNAVHNAIKNTPQLKDEFWSVWKVHDGDSFSHALQMAEKSARDEKAKQKIRDVIEKMCKDLKKEALRVEGFIN